jgi:hypothetical protein
MRKSEVSKRFSSVVVNGLSLTGTRHVKEDLRTVVPPSQIRLLLGFLGITIFPPGPLVVILFVPLYANSAGPSAALNINSLSDLQVLQPRLRRVLALGSGTRGNFIGQISSLILASAVKALSMLAIWPASSSAALTHGIHRSHCWYRRRRIFLSHPQMSSILDLETHPRQTFW